VQNLLLSGLPPTLAKPGHLDPDIGTAAAKAAANEGLGEAAPARAQKHEAVAAAPSGVPGLAQSLAPVADPLAAAAPAASASAPPSALAADPSAALPVVGNVPLGAVPVEIGLRSLAGLNRFEIRLDPAELGRIEVRLDISDGGEVQAQLVVDRVETLALLQRDARTLERAFEQAGLKPSEGGVDLTLRDPGQNLSGQQGRGEDRPQRPQAPETPRGVAEPSSPAPSPPVRPLWRGAAGIDVRI
jgi:flagellar hook-length control protein FliK